MRILDEFHNGNEHLLKSSIYNRPLSSGQLLAITGGKVSGPRKI